MFNTMRPSFSWSLTLVTCPPLLVSNSFGLHVAAPSSPNSCLIMHSRSPVTHLHGPLSWPIVMAHPPTNSHLFNVFKGILSTSPHCLPSIFPTLFGPGQVSHPHVGLSPLHPAHLTISPALHVLLTSLGPGQVPPVHTHLIYLNVCLSPVHL